MSEPTGESDPEPPSREEASYEAILRNKLELIPDTAQHAKVKLGHHACLRLFTYREDGLSAPAYGIKAAISEELAQTYRYLQVNQRHELESQVIASMNNYLIGDDQVIAENAARTQAMMNHQPLLFEPYEHAILQGEWRGYQKRRLVFESELVSRPEQRAILLGGLATVISFLHQNR